MTSSGYRNSFKKNKHSQANLLLNQLKSKVEEINHSMSFSKNSKQEKKQIGHKLSTLPQKNRMRGYLKRVQMTERMNLSCLRSLDEERI